MSAVFVAIEGPTAVGKSTVAGLLAARLAEVSTRPACVTTEPNPCAGWVGPWGNAWLTGRQLALARAAQRYVDLDEVIIPCLDAGWHVVADGYLHSALVWHRVDGVDIGEAWRYHTYLLEPLVSFCLREKPDRLAQRRAGRPMSRLERFAPPARQLSYHRDARRFLRRRGWRHHLLDCHRREPAELVELMLAYLTNRPRCPA